MTQPLLKNILFIDIETVSGHNNFDELNARMQDLWLKKSQRLKNDEELSLQDLYFNRAAIYAEFGKVICIAIGAFFENSDNPNNIKVKTLSNINEKELLEEFVKVVEKHPAKKNLVLCAHNGKEFDYPYLCRRMLINGIKLPEVLNISNKKPWEIPHIDTLEMWKFGDYKNYTSLELLAAVFDIATSKNDIDGSQVNNAYYNENDLDKISKYCKEDVVVLVQLYLKMNHLEALKEEQIHRV